MPVYFDLEHCYAALTDHGRFGTREGGVPLENNLGTFLLDIIPPIIHKVHYTTKVVWNRGRMGSVYSVGVTDLWLEPHKVACRVPVDTANLFEHAVDRTLQQQTAINVQRLGCSSTTIPLPDAQIFITSQK